MDIYTSITTKQFPCWFSQWLLFYTPRKLFYAPLKSNERTWKIIQIVNQVKCLSSLVVSFVSTATLASNEAGFRWPVVTLRTTSFSLLNAWRKCLPAIRQDAKFCHCVLSDVPCPGRKQTLVSPATKHSTIREQSICGASPIAVCLQVLVGLTFCPWNQTNQRKKVKKKKSWSRLTH